MTLKNLLSLSMFACSVATMVISVLCFSGAAKGDDSPVIEQATVEEAEFADRIRPLLTDFCLRCHHPDNMKSGVRVDQLTALPTDKQLFLLKAIQKQIVDEVMPPSEEPQLSADQRKELTGWIGRAMIAARSRNTQRNGSARRLTVAQYRNTLRDLLGLEENLTDILPPDSLSKDGFVNHGQTMLLSPLQVESYFDIAEKALDLCIIGENAKPVIQNFRMDFGSSINPNPCPDRLILGADNALLNNPDFVVTELKPAKPFDYQPFAMRTSFEFIEGYVGNDTIRAWKKFDSIYHAVFACVRGTPGYPKGLAYETVPRGLLLRPAIPSPEIFGQSNTYGPMANFKISLRELPDGGNFRVTVKASRYDDGLLLNAGAQVQDAAESVSVSTPELSQSKPAAATIKQDGIYQIDVYCLPDKTQNLLSLKLGERSFTGMLLESKPNPALTDSDKNPDAKPTAFVVIRLPAGEQAISAIHGDNSRLRRIVFTRLRDDSELARQFITFEQRWPSLGIYLGLRRDCGSTLTQAGSPHRIESGEIHEYTFAGAIKNFPNPDVEKDNVNYLAGVREIGIRSEFTDGRDMPRLLIQSVEFEGPYYESWPPATHRNIFLDSPQRENPEAYAREVIRSFATRAYRRPVSTTEEDAIFGVWQKSFESDRNMQRSIKDALLVVLTAPQFLFLIENSRTPEPENLDPDELASKLSYFLWNTAPDNQLLELAARNELHSALDSEFDRMLHDARFGQFVNEFASQWLSLDKFDVVSIDSKRYPRMTRDAKIQLRQEPIHYLRYAIDNNLPLRDLLKSDFVMANEVVANYYSLANRTENGFRFVPIKHETENLGGLLTQASILAGLSDGRESNPVKRGAWVARKIVAEPPDDPPPNVPQIKEDESARLTLREKLELHRNQQGCVKCHSGIDPWGIPFEQFDASGIKKTETGIDARSTLPDGTEVNDLNGLKTYLANDRIDQFAFSFLKHIACYAVGRSLTYNEIVYLQEHGVELRSSDYRLQDLMRFVVKSELFLKK